MTARFSISIFIFTLLLYPTVSAYWNCFMVAPQSFITFSSLPLWWIHFCLHHKESWERGVFLTFGFWCADRMCSFFLSAAIHIHVRTMKRRSQSLSWSSFPLHIWLKVNVLQTATSSSSTSSSSCQFSIFQTHVFYKVQGSPYEKMCLILSNCVLDKMT